MAYAAVVSVKETIQRLKKSSSHIISPETIGSAYDEVLSLQDVLKRLNNNNINRGPSVNALDGQIKETVCELEHLLESYEFPSQSEGDPSPSSLKIDADIDFFIQSVRKLKEDYHSELCRQLPEEEDDGVSPIVDFIENVVGVGDLFGRIKYCLLNGLGPNTRIVNLIGMAGIGKSTLARKIFEDQSIGEYFESRVWVIVGPKYHLNEILYSILAQVIPDIDKIIERGDDRKRLSIMEKLMRRNLEDRRLLVVLDDVWGKKLKNDLKRFLPIQCESGLVMTSRSKNAVYTEISPKFHHYMELLNKVDSWNLLGQRVFGEAKLCPSRLQKPGKKIAENCEGLPLTIVIVADILSKAEKTTEFWEAVAEKQTSVFKDAYDQMSKVLLPSYKYLPQHLKPCFLYMGVFPQNFIVHCSKLFMLWIAEGFLEPDPSKTLEDIAMKYLKNLDDDSLIFVRQSGHEYEPKSCGLHSVFWYLCNREAQKSKFFHVMNTHADGSAQVVKGQRRLSVHNNVLFAIKDVHDSMASNVSGARTLLCAGPHHRYPVPMCFGLRFLKILDALTVRFYEFPTEVVELVRLKYLALTCSGNIHRSISKLSNLQCLIIDQHLSITSSERCLPVEIWDMKELKHLYVAGNDLLNPRDGTLLPNLLTLSNFGTRSCTGNIFRAIPNLKKLSIRIELALDDDVEPSSCFDHISHLRKLESLKCVVVNPRLKSESISSPNRLSIFSQSLKKLTLSGLGYPWKCIGEIESLPMLEMLELKNYAFSGPKWETRDDGFPRLEVLLIEDSDLVQWTAGPCSFVNVSRLKLRHCYKLEEMPHEFGDLMFSIEVVECSPLTVRGAKRIRYNQLSREIGKVDIYEKSSCFGRDGQI